MTRILFVGQEPETVDFADPALLRFEDPPFEPRLHKMATLPANCRQSPLPTAAR